MKLNTIFFNLILILFTLMGCQPDSKKETPKKVTAKKAPKKVYEYGYLLNDFHVIKDTIVHGESFGEIMDRNNVGYGQIHQIVEEIKDTIDVRRLRAGKPYTILASKDSLQKAGVFIYEHNKIDYTVIHFQDSIASFTGKKSIKIVEKTASGVVTSNLSQAIEDAGLRMILAHELSDMYAWTVDFFRLQKGDKFKVIYEEKYINDTIYAGIGKIKAAYFEHGGKPFYGFEFAGNSLEIPDYYDETAGTLRRAFLKAPLKFSRISSRYNLKRRIKLYGNRVRPHKGTDFAAPSGTPIMSTANGTVVESSRRGGNGNFVKVRHNGTYSTQYLHMSKRAVRVGDVVKQGEVIGYVGMTGNTSGPHVCYRFWKNGRQVDPLREKLPAAEPLADRYKTTYFEFIKPLKTKLDAFPFPKETTNEDATKEFVESNSKNTDEISQHQSDNNKGLETSSSSL